MGAAVLAQGEVGAPDVARGDGTAWLTVDPERVFEVDALLRAGIEDVARQRLRSLGSVLVAYSGGVDSSYLLWLARDVLGNGAIAFTAPQARTWAALPPAR